MSQDILNSAIRRLGGWLFRAWSVSVGTRFFKNIHGVLRVAVCMACARASQAQSITAIPPLSGHVHSAAYAMTPDGSVVVGDSDDGVFEASAVRWTRVAGTQSLDAAHNNGNSTAYGVSADGSVIVGATWTSIYSAFRWTNSQGLAIMPRAQSRQWGLAFAVSADGESIVGQCSIVSGSMVSPVACRWPTPAQGVDLDPHVSGSSISESVNRDGSLIVGYDTAGRERAFLWSNSGVSYLPPIVAGDGMRAYDVTPNGTVVVGTSGTNAAQAFRWTSATGTVGLGTPPGLTRSQAFAVSDNGRTVVGLASTGVAGSGRATIWTQTTGNVDLAAMLASRGVPMQGWILDAARCVSADGRVVAGTGTYFNIARGWIAELWCPADFNRSNSVEVQDIFDYLGAWFAMDPRADNDGNGLTVQDIFDFLGAWFAGC